MNKLGDSSNSVLVYQDEWICPECGEVKGNIEITIPPYSGHYCLKCYARWIKENFPKLRKK